MMSATVHLEALLLSMVRLRRGPMMSPNNVVQATRSVLLHEDKRWSVYVLGKKVSESCLILKDQPHQIASAHELSLIIKLVDDASLCPGNPEKHYLVANELGEVKTLASIILQLLLKECYTRAQQERMIASCLFIELQ